MQIFSVFPFPRKIWQQRGCCPGELWENCFCGTIGNFYVFQDSQRRLTAAEGYFREIIDGNPVTVRLTY